MLWLPESDFGRIIVGNAYVYSPIALYYILKWVYKTLKMVHRHQVLIENLESNVHYIKYYMKHPLPPEDYTS